MSLEAWMQGGVPQEARAEDNPDTLVSEMLNIFEGRDSTGLPVELERNRRESSMPRRFLA